MTEENNTNSDDSSGYDDKEAIGMFIAATMAVRGAWDHMTADLLAVSIGIVAHSSLYGRQEDAGELLLEFLEHCKDAHDPMIAIVGKAGGAFSAEEGEREILEPLQEALTRIKKVIDDNTVQLPEHCVARTMIQNLPNLVGVGLHALIRGYFTLDSALGASYAGHDVEAKSKRDEFSTLMQHEWSIFAGDIVAAAKSPLCPKRVRLAKQIEDRFIEWRAEGLKDRDATENAMVDGKRVRDKILDAECDLDCPNHQC